MILNEGGGSSLWFATSGGGYASPAGDFTTLAAVSGGGWTRTFPNGTVDNFDSNGYQTSEVDRVGLRTTFAYDASHRVTTITDPYSQSSVFVYDGTTNKLNTITIHTSPAAAPTMAAARAAEVPVIQRSVHGFVLAGLSTVNRPAGMAVLIRYSADSQPDPVTGKVYKDAVERYEFYRNGTEAVVTLAGPAGADNVDPWRTVTNSFRWLQ